MPSNTPAALAAARRLITQAGAEAPDAGIGRDPAVVVAERAGRSLAAALSQWFGPYGYHALLMRALAERRADHPMLGAVIVRTPGEPYLDGLGDAAKTHGPVAVTEGVTAVLATVIDLLGRLIGEDMVLNLLEDGAPASAPDVASETSAESTP